MKANVTATLSALVSSFKTVREIDFSQVPTQTDYVAQRGKYKGQVVTLVAFSLVNPAFPDAVISDRGGIDMESVSSYPESKTGTARYNDALPANAFSAVLYGDMHLAKTGYGRKVTILPAPKANVIEQARALQTV